MEETVTVLKEKARFTSIVLKIYLGSLVMLLTLLVPGTWRPVKEFGLSIIRSSMEDMGQFFLNAALLVHYFN